MVNREKGERSLAGACCALAANLASLHSDETTPEATHTCTPLLSLPYLPSPLSHHFSLLDTTHGRHSPLSLSLLLCTRGQQASDGRCIPLPLLGYLPCPPSHRHTPRTPNGHHARRHGHGHGGDLTSSYLCSWTTWRCSGEGHVPQRQEPRRPLPSPCPPTPMSCHVISSNSWQATSPPSRLHLPTPLATSTSLQIVAPCLRHVARRPSRPIQRCRLHKSPSPRPGAPCTARHALKRHSTLPFSPFATKPATLHMIIC
jgi:hypothetical protein